jgi:hypothetical protein
MKKCQLELLLLFSIIGFILSVVAAVIFGGIEINNLIAGLFVVSLFAGIYVLPKH